MPLLGSPWKRWAEPNCTDDTCPDETQQHQWDKRSDKISMGDKEVNFWDFITILSEKYPSYPDYYRYPQTTKDWDTSRWTGVKKYFHNSSATCPSFGVAQFPTFDEVYPWPKSGGTANNPFQFVRGKTYHQTYQTEHVFEAQTIGRFFTLWLLNSAQRRRSVIWVESYILTGRANWGNSHGLDNSFAHLVIDELGSKLHEDRMTVLLSRPNGHEGRLFDGSTAVSLPKFAGAAAGDEQLLMAREIGMVFAYMNLDTVWTSFCDVYNGILSLLTTFDDWYRRQTGDTSELRLEWPRFIRSELDMVVKSARDNLKALEQARKLSPLFTLRWRTIMGVANGEIQKVKLGRTDKCMNLPPSTLGRYTG